MVLAVSSLGMMIGRDREIAILTKSIADARAGQSSVLVVSGEPGIGKTALLHHVASLAPDAVVLTSTGIEDETDIPYAHLADIFRPAQGQINSLPDRQADCLRSVFALGPPTPSDRFVISVAILNLLSSLAARKPVLVLVDDAQWVDHSSRDVLLFVARRLHHENLTVFFGVRSGSLDQLRLDRFRHLALSGLDEDACRQLIARAGISRSQAATKSLIAKSGGNPLALLELPDVPRVGGIPTWVRNREPLPLTTVLQEAFGESVRSLAPRAQAALVLLAVTGAAPEEVLERALVASGLARHDLDQAEQAGLIVWNEGQPDFRHPLIRSAVYQATPAEQRRIAHYRAAEAFRYTDVPNRDERRAWHLITAGVSSDAQLADALEAKADRQLQTATFASAGSLFRLSAQLTPQTAIRAARLIKAAHGARLAGEIDECRQLIGLALGQNPDERTQVLLKYLQSRLDLWAGDKLNSRDRLVELITVCHEAGQQPDPHMYVDVALASVELGDLSMAESFSVEAVRRSASAAGDVALGILAVRALVCGLQGDNSVVEDLISREPEIAVHQPLSTDVDEQLLLLVGLAYLANEDTGHARSVLRRSVTAARMHSALGMLPFRLGRLAVTEMWEGDWAAAAAHGSESLTLASDTGWTGERLNSLVVCARVEAVTGQDEPCRRHAGEAIAMSSKTQTQSYRAMAHAALGSLHLARQEFASAAEHFMIVETFASVEGLIDSPLLWWTADLVECLIGDGRTDEAEVLLVSRSAVESSTSRPTLRAVLARARALVHTGDFDEHAAEAMRWHERTSMPFEKARTELLIGQSLRRRRDARARSQLAGSLATFERIGAVRWAERCRSELRAAGVRLPRAANELVNLTPQELQVSLAVGRGLSNKEVANQLFLSVKTVEYHLSKAFQKLGVTRRSQLTILLAQRGTASQVE